MKFLPDIPVRLRRMRLGAFTLTEMYISLAVFALVIAATVAVQYYGLNMYYLMQTKLTATASGRQTINIIRDQVRGSQWVYVGTFSNAAFTPVGGWGTQTGNAIQVFPTTNNIPYTVFFMNPVTSNLCCVTNGQACNAVGDGKVLTSWITNYFCFQAENCMGSVLGTNQNNRVIHLTMNYFAWEYPLAHVGNMYDHYTLQTRATRRSINGAAPQ